MYISPFIIWDEYLIRNALAANVRSNHWKLLILQAIMLTYWQLNMVSPNKGKFNFSIVSTVHFSHKKKIRDKLPLVLTGNLTTKTSISVIILDLLSSSFPHSHKIAAAAPHIISSKQKERRSVCDGGGSHNYFGGGNLSRALSTFLCSPSGQKCDFISHG